MIEVTRRPKVHSVWIEIIPETGEGYPKNLSIFKMKKTSDFWGLTKKTETSSENRDRFRFRAIPGSVGFIFRNERIVPGYGFGLSGLLRYKFRGLGSRSLRVVL